MTSDTSVMALFVATILSTVMLDALIILRVKMEVVGVVLRYVMGMAYVAAMMAGRQE